MILTGLAITTWAALSRRGLEDADKQEFSWGQTWTAVVDRSFFAQADLFAYGMLAVLVLSVTSRGTWRPSTGLKIFGVSLIATAVLAVGANLVPIFSSNLTGLAAATLVLLVALPSPSNGRSQNRLAQILEGPRIRYVGLISYSIYLWHVPVMWSFRERGLLWGGDWMGLVMNTLVITSVTLVAASITYFLIERPAIKLNQFFQRRFTLKNVVRANSQEVHTSH
jgi:peptidoglycan/LPS O-acetylase OafA/YrhL